MVNNKRNTSIDMIRGIAMLLVVLGHTIGVSAFDCESSVIMNIIWTLQMPLFIIISGYVTKYSGEISSGSDLWKYIKRRSCSYLIPWVVWTFLVRGFILGKIEFFNLKYLLWNMDTGYWFLTSIWTISVFFGVAQFLATKYCKKNMIWTKTVVSVIIIVVEMILLLSIGLAVGISFFGIKLTVYYAPFFVIGYLFSSMQERFSDKHWFKTVTEFVIAVSTIIYIAMIVRVNFYNAGDGLFEIILRVIASLSGCIMVFGVLGSKNINKHNETMIYRILKWVGVNSLGVYVTHSLFINVLKSIDIIYIGTLKGFLHIFANFIITTVFSSVIILIAQSNKLLNKILFYK